MKNKQFVALLLVLISFFVGIYIYPILPDKMPIHWNSYGQVDKFFAKGFATFLFPTLMLFIYLIFYFIPKIAIYKKNLMKFDKYYIEFKIVILSFMLLVYLGVLVQSFRQFNMNYLTIPLLSILFIFSGRLMKHSKVNFFIGFRTPWGLASEKVWKKTNLAAGNFFIGYGLFILFSLLLQQFLYIIILLPLFVGLPWLYYYSYKVFRSL
jgi:uncharacterized membrane protein